MRLILLMLFAIAVCDSSFAQTKTTSTAKSEGPCSPAVTGDNNTFRFEYCGSDPEEQKRMIRLLNAVSQGQVLTNSKLDQILEILLKPTKITVLKSGAVPAPPGKHPRAAITFYADDPIDRGQFEVACDHACTPVEICSLPGTNAGALATVSFDPYLAEFLLRRQFPATTQCELTVESRDDQEVKILKVEATARTNNLVWNAVQPVQRTISGGTVMQ
jgi:hypothetical protein